MKNKNIIPVFFAVDDGYIPFLGIALKSLIDNASDENKYQIKILYTNVSSENIKRIKNVTNFFIFTLFFDIIILF